MKFSYTKFDTGVYRPIIPIHLVAKDKGITYDVLIDSGADFCLFDSEIGELLGIDIKKGIKIETFGFQNTEQIAYINPVAIHIGEYEYHTKVGFVENLHAIGFGIVGQVGFFDRFNVQFDYRQKSIELLQKPKRYRSLFWSGIIKKNEKEMV